MATIFQINGQNILDGYAEVEMITALTGSTYMTYTFQKDYDAVIVFGYGLDSDNNGDNYFKVYDTAAGAGKDIISGGMWEPFKPVASTGSLGFAATSFANAIDQNTVTRITYNYNAFGRVQHKEDVKSGDTIHCYCSHGDPWGPIFFVVGCNWHVRTGE